MKNMKLSKILHVLSVIAGLVGVFYFAGIAVAVLGGTSGELVFGVTKVDALLCVVVVFLIAIWLQIATMHHMMLEKKGEII